METREKLTVAEVAREIGVHPRTVQRLIKNKKLRAIRPTERTTFIRREDFDSFIRRCGTMPKAAV